jgi:hypothetical protein
MPRYLVQRTFEGGLGLPASPEGRAAAQRIVDLNADLGVTWIQSFVSDDKAKTFCIYDAPTPEAIRQAASVNGLPVELITKVSVLDPYFYL